LHNNYYSPNTCSFQKLAEFPGFLILDVFALRPSKVDAKMEDLSPFTQEFLKVCSKIPFHLKEYLYFFKLSLKDHASSFSYFFELLKLHAEVLTTIKVSNES
jgi:hypothetical protein